MLDRALYALRHTQHHVGMINTELRRLGVPRPEWHYATPSQGLEPGVGGRVMNARHRMPISCEVAT